MRIPQIQITTQDAKLDINISDPTQRISQPKADLSIKQPKAELQINQTDSEIRIDMTQLWNDLGLKQPKELIRSQAQRARQEMLDGIAQKASEGRQLMLGAGKGQNTIGQLMIQNHGPKRPGPYNIQFIPSFEAIKVSFTKGNIDVNIQANQPIIDATPHEATHDYTPGKVSGTLVQKASIQIDVLK